MKLSNDDEVGATGQEDLNASDHSWMLADDVGTLREDSDNSSEDNKPSTPQDVAEAAAQLSIGSHGEENEESSGSNDVDGDDDSHLFPPFSSALMVEAATIPTDDKTFPPMSEVQAPHLVEVDAESGTIHVKWDHSDVSETDTHAQTSEERLSSRSRLAALSHYQRCWLIVFVRKWARKTNAYTHATAHRYSLKVEPIARRSAAAIQKASKRSVAYACRKTEQGKKTIADFDEKHHLSRGAKSSVKKISNVTLSGCKVAYSTTSKSLKIFDNKHHVVRKTKNSFKTGGRMIRNAWNGNP